MRLFCLGLVLLLGAGAVRAHESHLQSAPQPPTAEQAADAVLAAVQANALDALNSHAAKDGPDPWLVADELCYRQEYDAAEAYARAAKGPETTKLPRYVATRRMAGPDETEREVFEAMNHARVRGAWRGVLEVAGPDRRPGDSVTEVRIGHVRGVALVELGRRGEGILALGQTANAAQAVGWLRRAARVQHDRGEIAYRAGDLRTALEAWTTCLRLNERLARERRVCDTLLNIGNTLASLGEYSGARQALHRSLEMAEALEHQAGISRALAGIGDVRGQQGKRRRALESYRQALQIQGSLDDREAAAKTLHNMGLQYTALGEHEQALHCLDRSLDVFEDLDHRREVAGALLSIGNVYRASRQQARALQAYTRSLKMAESAAHHFVIADALHNIGVVHKERGQYAEALHHFERALPLYRTTGHRRGLARTLSVVAGLQLRIGEYAKARDNYRHALGLYQAMGLSAEVAGALAGLGLCSEKRDDHRESLEYYQQALSLEEGLDNPAGVAGILGRMGVVYLKTGQLSKGLHHCEQALRLSTAAGDVTGIATNSGNLAIAYERLGQYARALAQYRRTLEVHERAKHRSGVAMTLQNMGNVHEKTGEYDEALASYRRALGIFEDLGEKAGMSGVLGNIGVVHWRRNEQSEALECLRRALALERAIGRPLSEAFVLQNLGNVHWDLGREEEALDRYRRAFELMEAHGDHASAASALANLAIRYAEQGHYEMVLEAYARVHELLDEAPSPLTRARAFWGLAMVHSSRREWSLARARARDAAEVVRRLFTGLGEQQGTAAQELWTGVFTIGAQAALENGALDDLCFFLESSRAGILLESLRAREALRTTQIPEKELVAEARARYAVQRALAAFRRARASGVRTERRRAKEALDDARRDAEMAFRMIQQSARAAASIVYTGADDLPRLQERLAPDEVLVLYGLAEKSALALVVRRRGSRAVKLGTSSDVVGACLKLLQDAKPYVDASQVTRLRELVVGPLELEEDVRRILVSPMGPLAYVPFSLLVPGKEVACVPSGTTLGLLLEDRDLRGDGVLALGDPDYPPGGRWRPLPATSREVRAVGTRILEGPDATEDAFAQALEEQVRWRSVHLACHAFVNTERPLLSSLALSPGRETDGLLSVHEVFRVKVPTDLVVLSACETGKGKLYLTEGIVGLTRAFMYAGAPRVICSLWKVDDEATRALMIRFYELWNPKEGEGLGTAAALKQAQEFIRDHPDHPEWKHPYYWAAWVLWGLPD